MDWINCDYLVVIVNYRTPGDVVECLDSLLDEVQAMHATQVLVVDNCSGDDSFSLISNHIDSKGYQAWAKAIEAEGNNGFSAGNNCAIKAALAAPTPPTYIHLLNPDTLAKPGALAELKTFMDGNPKVGIAGSRQLIPAGEWNKAFRFPSIWSEIDLSFKFGPISRILKNKRVSRDMGAENDEVDWVSGASMIVRKAVFDDIGLMDENYFLYYEETDFCLNAQRAGWQIYHVPSSLVFHKVGTSTGVTRKSDKPKRKPSYVYESKNYYYTKNYGALYALTVNAVTFVGLFTNRIGSLLLGKEYDKTPHLLRDTLAHTADIFKSKN